MRTAVLPAIGGVGNGSVELSTAFESALGATVLPTRSDWANTGAVPATANASRMDMPVNACLRLPSAASDFKESTMPFSLPMPVNFELMATHKPTEQFELPGIATRDNGLVSLMAG